MPDSDPRPGTASYATLINQYGALRSVLAFVPALALGYWLGPRVGAIVAPHAEAGRAELCGALAALSTLLVAVQARAAGRFWGASVAWGLVVGAVGFALTSHV